MACPRVATGNRPRHNPGIANRTEGGIPQPDDKGLSTHDGLLVVDCSKAFGGHGRDARIRLETTIRR